MPIHIDTPTIHDVLHRGVEDTVGKDQLEQQLTKGEPLRIKLGIDPTSPNIHLGRSVPLLKLRDFQALGHHVVLIIGDFTGVIGDTSDKESERPMLTHETIKENMAAYAEQAGKILDMDKCEVHLNSEWLQNMTFAQVGELANHFSIAEFIARDNIRRRLDAGKRVSLRETLYPLMQGYDSVAIKADVELGGTDQRFNLLAGRSLQEAHGQTPQSIIMGPLVEGTDGRKMSSSWGNTVNLTDSPTDMFGKLMSIPDELIIKYFTLMTRVSVETIATYKQAMDEGANPRDYKMKLGQEIVTMYHSEQEAVAAKDAFIQMFAKKQRPDTIRELSVSSPVIVDVLIEAGFATSKSDARRTISGGGVKINDEKISDDTVTVTPGDVIQKGKRFFVTIV